MPAPETPVTSKEPPAAKENEQSRKSSVPSGRATKIPSAAKPPEDASDATALSFASTSSMCAVKPLSRRTTAAYSAIVPYASTK